MTALTDSGRHRFGQRVLFGLLGMPQAWAMTGFTANQLIVAGESQKRRAGPRLLVSAGDMAGQAVKI